MAEFTVSYERKFSDRNYGSEGVSASWTWDPHDQPDMHFPEDQVHNAVQILKTMVLGELARSAAESVRWAAEHELNPPAAREPVNAHMPDDDNLEDLPY